MKKCIPLNCYSFYTFLYLLILENKLNTPSKEAKQRLERETKNRETKTFQIKNLSNLIKNKGYWDLGSSSSNRIFRTSAGDESGAGGSEQHVWCPHEMWLSNG